ncbi:2'-5' RNA ligase family protein [Parafrankia sp. FMc6]|uniref:2'-5' RNA ligase family protein n=1 Tax=Parafrankia soli TaxID=2599596 RepID=UPI0034D48ED4
MTTSPTTNPVMDDWHRFTSLDRLDNHWDRPGWTPGRRSYHWMLTFENATELHTLADRCQQRLRLPVLDPVPPDGLHLTLRRLAFTDQIGRADVDRAVEQTCVRLAGVEPFSLAVGPLAGSSGAVRFSVLPWAPVVAVRDGLIEAITAVLGPAAVVVKPNGFRPHVGIAYCNSRTDAHPIISAVRELRELPPVRVTVGAVALVELRREERAYRWDTSARVRLVSAC